LKGRPDGVISDLMSHMFLSPADFLLNYSLHGLEVTAADRHKISDDVGSLSVANLKKLVNWDQIQPLWTSFLRLLSLFAFYLSSPRTEH